MSLSLSPSSCFAHCVSLLNAYVKKTRKQKKKLFLFSYIFLCVQLFANVRIYLVNLLFFLVGRFSFEYSKANMREEYDTRVYGATEMRRNYVFVNLFPNVMKH